MTACWMDWNGFVRGVEHPGEGYKCKVVEGSGRKFVDVYCSSGYVVHEADYYASILELAQVAVDYGFEIKFYEGV